MKTPKKLKKSVKITLGTLIVYILLVATHLGEFWPFSIYPMFSQAGSPWKRAIVQDISNTTVNNVWKNKKDAENLPGETVPLNTLNVNTNDIANYLFKTEVWTEEKKSGVRKLLKEKLDNGKLLVYQARGALTKSGQAETEYIPYLYLTSDTTELYHKLRSN